MHSAVNNIAGAGPGGGSVGPPPAGSKGKPGKGPLYHIDDRMMESMAGLS